MLFFEIIYLGVSGLRAFAFAGALFYGNFLKKRIYIFYTNLFIMSKEGIFFICVEFVRS